MTTHSYQLINAQRQLLDARRRAGIDYRPTIPAGDGRLPSMDHFNIQTTRSLPDQLIAAHTNHHGDIALAAMRADQACHYQLWLCLRLLDALGGGRLALSDVKDHLTRKSSPAFMYRWPRLRQLLTEGNGRFWLYDRDHIWLRSTVRLAISLGVTRLNGRFMAIAKEDICGRTAVFRAHCYAAWLSQHTNPFSQTTTERLTGISPRTQRRYCRLANITVQQNIAVGPPARSADSQDVAWQHGNVFEFCDFQGQQGPPFRRYLAWHLPANYAVSAPQGSRRHQKQHNRQLAIDLAKTGRPGNGRPFDGTRLFYAHGKAAAKAANRRMSGGPATDIYWPHRRARTGAGIWHVIGGQIA